MTITPQTTVGSIATEHPLSTRVFDRHGLDFCCGGGRSLADACARAEVELDLVLSELSDELGPQDGSETRWDQEPLPELIDHILREYHEPLREELPRLEAMSRKVLEVHGSKDPERFRGILETLVALQTELRDHMMKEERILFPMIRRGEGAMAGGPVSVMEMEHDDAGAALRRFRRLTDGYEPQEEACTTWRALWAGLGDLERSLHEHIHLENNILFPRALAGE